MVAYVTRGTYLNIVTVMQICSITVKAVMKIWRNKWIPFHGQYSFLMYSAAATACEYSIRKMGGDGNRGLQDVPPGGMDMRKKGVGLREGGGRRWQFQLLKLMGKI